MTQEGQLQHIPFPKEGKTEVIRDKGHQRFSNINETRVKGLKEAKK